MASLLGLPLELLVAISSHLATPDLCALRITCKQVEKSLYEWFAQEFFTKKQFMLTHESLQTLIDISKHAAFSKKLTHIIIATNAYGETPYLFRDDEAAFRYAQGQNDQSVLHSTGMDREMLTEAFKNLPNLEVVGIRNFNAKNRRRDGMDAAWSSWGATTVFQQTGVSMVMTAPGHTLPAGIDCHGRTFQALIYALGKANATPKALELLIRHQGLPDDAFHVPQFSQSTVAPVLAGLKTLLLAANTHANVPHSVANGVGPAAMVEYCSGRNLRRFISLTPNLEHLRLNFQQHNYQFNEFFMQWLAEPVMSVGTLSPFDTAPVHLSKLTHLELGQMQVKAEAILNVISKFAPTITDLSLWNMGISYLGPFPGQEPPNVWAKAFRRIANMGQLNLSHFKAGMLRQDRFPVSFQNPEKEDSQLYVIEHTGGDMVTFLNQVVDRTVVKWPQDTINRPNNGEDDEMEDDENDDENMEDEDEDEDEDESSDDDE